LEENLICDGEVDCLFNDVDEIKCNF